MKNSYSLTRHLTKLRALIILVSLVLLILFWFSLPNPLFNNPYSIVVEDKNDKLLGAIIAEDGQWRFPLVESVPDKFVTAITQFEDKNFFYHPGVNPFSLVRAAYKNIEEGSRSWLRRNLKEISRMLM